MGFVFYDTETTGTNTNFDQILQFGAIRTDSDLKEIERFECRSRLLPYVVPSPGAIKVTKTSVQQLTDSSLPSHYDMVRAIQEKLLAWSPAIFVGHNSIRFDEHLLRQALFKTLHPPYLTNTNGNCRSDSMKMIQAVSIFAPDILKIPTDTEGKEIFKLDQLAPANGFNHEKAHEAMADVEATIYLCRLIAKKAPLLWSNFMRFGQKAAVNDFVEDELLYSFSEFYFGKGYSWIVTTLGQNPDMDIEIFVFNLSVDPNTLIDLNDEELRERLASQPKPVRSLKTNAFPIIFPFHDFPDHLKVAIPDQNELEARAEQLKENIDLRNRLINTFISIQDIKEPSEHVEEQIYDCFIPWDDQDTMEIFHNIDWFDRINHINQLQDERLRKLGQLLIFSEKPEVFSTADRDIFKRKLARRMLQPEGSVPWLTLPQAIKETNELLSKSKGDDFQLLSEFKSYLVEKSDEAKSYL